MRLSAIMKIKTGRDRFVLEVRTQVVPDMGTSRDGLSQVRPHDFGYVYWSQTDRSLELRDGWSRVSACFEHSGVTFDQRGRQFIIAPPDIEVRHPTPFVPNIEFEPGTIPQTTLEALYAALIELGLEEDDAACVDIQVIDYDRPPIGGDNLLDGRTILTLTCPTLDRSLLYLAADTVRTYETVLGMLRISELDLTRHRYYPHVYSPGPLASAVQMGQIMAMMSRPLA